MAKKKKPKRRQKPEPAATEQPLIFLDIDGVLAPFGGRPPGPPAATRSEARRRRCVRALRRAMHATPGRDRGSDRRRDRTFLLVARARADAVAVIERRFRAFGPPLSETVPLPTTDVNYHSVRQWEIARYLEKHPARRWVALDDEGLRRRGVRRAPAVVRRTVSTSTRPAGLNNVDEAIRVLLSCLQDATAPWTRGRRRRGA